MLFLYKESFLCINIEYVFLIKMVSISKIIHQVFLDLSNIFGKSKYKILSLLFLLPKVLSSEMNWILEKTSLTEIRNRIIILLSPKSYFKLLDK